MGLWTHPFSQQSSDSKGQESSTKGNSAKAVRLLLKLNGHDDCDADGPGKQHAIIDRGDGDAYISHLQVGVIKVGERKLDPFAT